MLLSPGKIMSDSYKDKYIWFSKALGLPEERAIEEESHFCYSLIAKHGLSPLIMADRLLEKVQKEGEISAPVHAISRHRVGVDGKGITTLVTFYGCPLRCKYCLNPQTLGRIPELSYITPEQLYERVRKDALYFLATGGGITFGGGEPCLRSNFIREFRKLCGNSWNLRIETTLNIQSSRIRELLPIIDQWIVDMKEWDVTMYERYTGYNNDLVKHNLEFLAREGLQDKVLIRLPLIPGFVKEKARQNSTMPLRKMGYNNFDFFTYKIPSK